MTAAPEIVASADGQAVTILLRLAPGMSLEIRGPSETIARLTSRLSEALGASPASDIVASVTVVPVPRSAPRFPDEAVTYALVRWSDGSTAAVEMQRATATISWPGQGRDPITATVAVAGDDPRALQHVLMLLASIALPATGRGALVHASVAVLQGQAMVFLGESGAGKSTTAARLEAEGAVLLADDMVLLWLQDDRLCVAPFFGDGHFASLSGERVGTTWLVGGVFSLHKDAAQLEVRGATREPVTTWLRAFFGPAAPPARSSVSLDTAARMAALAPPSELLVPRSGALRPVLDAHVADAADVAEAACPS